MGRSKPCGGSYRWATDPSKVAVAGSSLPGGPGEAAAAGESGLGARSGRLASGRRMDLKKASTTAPNPNGRVKPQINNPRTGIVYMMVKMIAPSTRAIRGVDSSFQFNPP